MNTSQKWTRGPIAWMAQNNVAANLLMAILIVGGIFSAMQVKKEVFPYFQLPEVRVSVTVNGATPEEIEKGVILAIEEVIKDIDGIEETTAFAHPGSGRVTIEGIEGVDGNILLQDIKAAVDRITTFPEDADEPIIELVSSRRQVLALMLTGGGSSVALRHWAENIREELSQDPDISQVVLDGVRDHEVWVEVPQETLRRYGLTVGDVALAIEKTAIQQGGGTVRAPSGDILIRLNERRDYAHDFSSVAVRTNPDGSRLLLEDIATISNTFDDSDNRSEFNGVEAIPIFVYSFGDESPEDVANATLRHVERFNSTMPGDLTLHVRDNIADLYIDRRDLLLENATIGMILVFLCLALFLRFSLAFWVSLGIPISMLGSFWFFFPLGISINMMSLFAFLVTLGIVVDDAIVVGENVSAWQERGVSPLKAAVCGAREVASPVTFSVITNMLAFLPILFIPGTMGKIWMVIPLIVISVFSLSLIESLFILPAHLAHSKNKYTSPEKTEENLNLVPPAKKSLIAKFSTWQQRFNAGILHIIHVHFAAFMHKILAWRYVVLTASIALLCITAAYVQSGRMGFDLMQRVEADYSYVAVELPDGTPRAEVNKIADHVVKCAKDIIDAHGGEALSTGISVFFRGEDLFIQAYLVPPDVRPMSTYDFTTKWREAVGILPGVDSITFEADRGGPGSGSSLNIRLSHRNTDILNQAVKDLGNRLSTYAGVDDVNTGSSRSLRQFDVSLTPVAEQLGFTAQDVSTQIRHAFEGALALRQQRDSNEVTVRVRLPEKDRESEATFEELMLRSPQGQEVLLRDVIYLDDTRAEAMIRHINGRRTLTVTANVTPSSETGRMMQVVSNDIMPQLLASYTGLSWEFGGRQADMQESSATMMYGFIMALIGIYALLAIPFKSYTQPLIIMISIPFGIVGAVGGHMLMGYTLSMSSVFGIVALSGVVVNNSLVLIDFANQQRSQGSSIWEAIHKAAIQRCRPIILTTITTFVGLAPLIFETSRQAQFLIPMAISLAFGILFSTLICLLLVPSLYLILNDVYNWRKSYFMRTTSS